MDYGPPMWQDHMWLEGEMRPKGETRPKGKKIKYKILRIPSLILGDNIQDIRKEQRSKELVGLKLE